MRLSDEVIDVIGCVRNQDAIGYEERMLLIGAIEMLEMRCATFERRNLHLKSDIEFLRDDYTEATWKFEMYERLHRSFYETTVCDICGKLAACIGWSSDLGVMAMCNEHCGHGNEDHVCHNVLAHC